MRTNAVWKLRPRQDAEDFGEMSPSNSNRPQVAGAHADYCRDDYIFPRTQSPRMRAMRWERSEPLKNWGSNFVADLAWEMFA
jgi:hypothetical protein